MCDAIYAEFFLPRAAVAAAADCPVLTTDGEMSDGPKQVSFDGGLRAEEDATAHHSVSEGGSAKPRVSTDCHLLPPRCQV